MNHVICRKMDRTGDNHVKVNKPDSERQILHTSSHMQNLQKEKRHERLRCKEEYLE
jgi:hypothetical protein